jgi:hypothetical protein
MRTWLAIAAVAAVVAAACGPAQGGPVKIGTTWPEKPGGYASTTARWTMWGSVRSDVDLLYEVHATLKSAEWRAAYVDEYTKRMSLTEDERSKLAAEQAKAASELWEVELIVETHESSWQDLASAKSMWRLALVGDEGREVLPLSVKLDARNQADLESWFPAMHWRQQRAYVVTFPAMGSDQQPLVREGAERLTLEVAAPVGKVNLVWKGK